MAQEGKLRVVAAGEKVSASTVVVGSPVILQHAVDLCPQVEFKNFFVIVDEVIDMLGRRSSPGSASEPKSSYSAPREFWVPTSERVHQHMLTDPRYPSPHPQSLEV